MGPLALRTARSIGQKPLTDPGATGAASPRPLNRVTTRLKIALSLPTMVTDAFQFSIYLLKQAVDTYTTPVEK